MMRHGELWLRGLLASRDGTEVMRGDKAAAVTDRPAPMRSAARSPTNSSRGARRGSSALMEAIDFAAT